MIVEDVGNFTVKKKHDCFSANSGRVFLKICSKCTCLALQWNNKGRSPRISGVCMRCRTWYKGHPGRFTVFQLWSHGEMLLCWHQGVSACWLTGRIKEAVVLLSRTMEKKRPFYKPCRWCGTCVWSSFLILNSPRWSRSRHEKNGTCLRQRNNIVNFLSYFCVHKILLHIQKWLEGFYIGLRRPFSAGTFHQNASQICAVTFVCSQTAARIAIII